MSQELIVKIEEKLGGAIDLMTFDNAQQVVDCVSKYLQLKYLISTSIAGVICIICTIVALTNYKEDNYEVVVVSAIIGFIFLYFFSHFFIAQ